ncbi:FUSC family protein [Acinetobacter rudis]|uniref:FUSC family protein n=1 Tax=Acinetobacter rudis TaxID=632955 RepID=UPI00280ECF11|nr:FUSC family protein [Acinetobacter rudis]MDQ8954101.1 FUSC family protein [Acinetobacter rudis]
MFFKPLLSFRPSRLDLIFASKTFVAAMLALFVSFELNLVNPMWSIGTVLIIASPYSGMVSSKCIYRLIGTIAGAIVAVLLMPHLLNTPWIFTAVLALWVGFSLYVSLLDRTPRSYVFMLAGYSTVLIVFNAIASIDTYSIFDMALARVLEISVGVISSAIVSASFFPVHLGAVIRQRVNKALKDLEDVFERLLDEQNSTQDDTQILSIMTRDMADIHALAVHLAYEKGELNGMTKPLQEMLHQMSLVVANLVALSQRIKQLDQLSQSQSSLNVQLQQIKHLVLALINKNECTQESDLKILLSEFERDFDKNTLLISVEQQTLMAALKMDIRHFMTNILTVKLLWQSIQQGKKSIPSSVTAITTNYPSLHRDYGVAVRGGVSATLITLIVTSIWILSGWKYGFMMAQMGVITACILTAIDNPVPVLRIFIVWSVISAGLAFIYAFGIFPHVTDFWQLAVVLLPLVLIAVSMMANPLLMPVGMVLGINTMMGLNLNNRYSMDPVAYLDNSVAMILGVMTSLIVIDLVRAMSPDTSASRILSLHYQALRQSIYLSYDTEFKVHLRSMLDRVGVLNSKAVQAPKIKTAIHNALIESSAIVDLVRLQELILKLSDVELRQQLSLLQQNLDEYFRFQQKHLAYTDHFSEELQHQIDSILMQVESLEDAQLKQRLLISLNNIYSSIGHVIVAHPFNATKEVLVHG